MAQRSGPQRVTGAIADATGRTDDEVRLALTVAVAAAGVIAALRLLEFLGELGAVLFGRSRR